MKFDRRFIVGPADIDDQGHVNNVAYVKWIQDVAVAHWRHAATPEEQNSFVWVVIRHEIDYKKQAFENDEINASTWVGEWSKVTCERLTRITRGDDLLVKSRTVWCMLDRERSKPIRIPTELKQRFR